MRKFRIKTNCLNCSAEMFVVHSKLMAGAGKYCSRSCRQINLWANPEYRKQHCLSLKGRVSPRKGIKITEETRKRMSEGQKKRAPFPEEHRRKISRKGERHYKWKKDRTTLAKRQERNDYAYQEWRKNVKKRDNYKCKMSGQSCNGQIEAHHILQWALYPDLRYEIDNGITLCHRTLLA